MAFQIVRNDITKMHADAIVNTANELVGYGDGVDAAIYEAAGKEQLLVARAKIGELAVGELGVTPAYNLDAKYIIHICGSFYEENQESIDLLKKCYSSCLDKARELGCQSIAFPLLATGTFGFPREQALRIALNCFMNFLEKWDMEILLVVFDRQSVKASEKIVSGLQEFIDDNYVEEQLDAEYDFGRPDSIVYPSAPMEKCMSIPEPPSVPRPSSVDKGRPRSLFGGALRGRTVKAESMMRVMADEQAEVDSAVEAKLENLKNLPDYGAYIQQLINRKGMKNSEAYKKANWTKQYFSKVMAGQITPAKEKLFTLALALELNMDETVDFLRMSGYAFSPCSKVDLVVEYCIRQMIFDLTEVEIKLDDLGLPTLSNY